MRSADSSNESDSSASVGTACRIERAQVVAPALVRLAEDLLDDSSSPPSAAVPRYAGESPHRIEAELGHVGGGLRPVRLGIQAFPDLAQKRDPAQRRGESAMVRRLRPLRRVRSAHRAGYRAPRSGSAARDVGRDVLARRRPAPPGDRPAMRRRRRGWRREASSRSLALDFLAAADIAAREPDPRTDAPIEGDGAGPCSRSQRQWRSFGWTEDPRRSAADGQSGIGSAAARRCQGSHDCFSARMKARAWVVRSWVCWVTSEIRCMARTRS